MASVADTPNELRLLSVVEALTVTGPVKPMLTFSTLMRDGFGNCKFAHAIATTRRSRRTSWSRDHLFVAAEKAGVECIALAESGPFDVRVLFRLRRAIYQFRPHIVETHDYKSHLLFRVLRAVDSSLKRLKWVAFHHGYTRTSWKVLVYQQFDRLTLRDADRVLTVCQPFAATLISRGVCREKVSVIGNTTAAQPSPTPEAIAKARIALGLADDEYVILAVGRLSREKGYCDLFAALRIVVENGLNRTRLVIVGDGPQRRQLQRLAAPLASTVVFSGQVADPWPFYYLADLFVLPSHSEGSPLVILEAMAAGLPIVSTAVGGVPEMLINRRSALLVAPRSPAELASAIMELLLNESLRNQLALEALATSSQRSPVAYANSLLSIYKGICEVDGEAEP